MNRNLAKLMARSSAFVVVDRLAWGIKYGSEMRPASTSCAEPFVPSDPLGYSEDFYRRGREADEAAQAQRDRRRERNKRNQDAQQRVKRGTA